MLAGSHRNAWPDETGTGGRTNRNTQGSPILDGMDMLFGRCILIINEDT